MSTSESQNPDVLVVNEDAEGIPHPPGTQVKEISVNHPITGETHTIYIPADHDGSRIRVEFPGNGSDRDTAYGWTEGFDPAEMTIAGGEVVSEAEQITSDDSGQSQQGAG